MQHGTYNLGDYWYMHVDSILPNGQSWSSGSGWTVSDIGTVAASDPCGAWTGPHVHQAGDNSAALHGLACHRCGEPVAPSILGRRLTGAWRRPLAALLVLSCAFAAACGGDAGEPGAGPTGTRSPGTPGDGASPAPSSTPARLPDLTPAFGQRIDVVVEAGTPQTEGPCTDLLPYMTVTTGGEGPPPSVIPCVVDGLARTHLHFHLRADGAYEIASTQVLLLFASDPPGSFSSCDALYADGMLWPVSSPPGEAPLRGVCDAQAFAADDGAGLREVYAALPDRVRPDFPAGEPEPCWALARFLGGPLNQPAMFYVPCRLQ